MSTSPWWYLDSSVLLRAAMGDSSFADCWLTECASRKEGVFASVWLATEVRRVAHNRRLRGEKDITAAVEARLSGVELTAIDAELFDEAAEIPAVLRAGDALHLATALRLAKYGADVVVVTHDVQLAAAAATVGLRVFDPVTDDPSRPPVA